MTCCGMIYHIQNIYQSSLTSLESMFSSINTLKFPEKRVLRLDRLRELKVCLLQRQPEEHQGLHHGKLIPGCKLMILMVVTLYFSQSLGGKVNRRLVLPGRGEAPPEDRGGGGGGEHSASY